MAEQIGAQIKEARLAAGMTQKALAEAVDGLSARAISDAERGLKELTDEQLAAIAEATGADPGLFSVEKDEAPSASAETAAPVVEGDDILELFNAADPAAKAAALSVLKGETPQSKNFLADIVEGILPMVTGLLGGDKGGNPLVGIIGFLSSEEGKAFLDTLKGVLDNVTGTFGGGGAEASEAQDGKKTSDSFLAFTFFYTVAIYILLIGFHYLQGRKDIKLGELIS